MNLTKARQGPATVVLGNLGDAGPADDLETAIMVLEDTGARLDPIAGVDVAHAEHVAVRGVVNMAANNTLCLMTLSFGREVLFEVTDVIHDLLDLTLCPRRQRPVVKPEAASRHVEIGVARE